MGLLPGSFSVDHSTEAQRVPFFFLCLCPGALKGVPWPCWKIPPWNWFPVLVRSSMLLEISLISSSWPPFPSEMSDSSPYADFVGNLALSFHRIKERFHHSWIPSYVFGCIWPFYPWQPTFSPLVSCSRQSFQLMLWSACSSSPQIHRLKF